MQNRVNKKFCEALEAGNMDAAQKLLESTAFRKHINLADPQVFNTACSYASPKIMEMIVNQPEILELSEKLFEACQNGDIQTVRELVENPNLKKNINIAEKRYFDVACEYFYEDLMDYLLAQPEVIKGGQVTDIISYHFASACFTANLEKAQFLFRNKKYGDHLDLTYKSTVCFRNAYDNKDIDMLTFLIFEAGITRDDNHVSAAMRTGSDPKFFKEVIDLFNKQKLPGQLDNALPEKDVEVQRKIKI